MTDRLDDLLPGPDDDGAGADRDALAVHAAGIDYSRGELNRRAEAIAAAIGTAGGGAGTPIGVMLPDGADLIATLFAVWRAGGVYVPLNPRLGTDDLQHVLDTVDPTVIVTQVVPIATSDRARVPPRRRAGDEDEERTASDPGLASFGDRSLVLLDDELSVRSGTANPRRYDDDVALIQFTSGTTGRPKPVVLEHAGVLSLIDGVLAKIRGATRAAGRDRARTHPPMPNLIPVSLSLWAGIYQVLFAFRADNPVVVMDGFDTREFADLVERFQIRSTVLPPAAMTMLCDDDTVGDLAPLRFVRSITAPLSPFQARRFRERFGISVLNAYGQTEIGGEIVGWNAADSREFGDTKLGSVGRPHEGVQIRIIPSDPRQQTSAERARSVAQNRVGANQEVGEIVVKTPAMSAGYADGGDLADRLTDDGWFRTGDVGCVDDDGFLWIEGRLSDMINRGGLKVFPTEVEDVVRLSPAVDDVAVVPAPDDRLGEVPVAFVVTAPGAGLHAAALAEHCRGHLAPYKIPAAFHPVAALPRNEVGKVLKAELATLARSAPSDD